MIFGPIYYDPELDTVETIEAILAHNARWCTVCDPDGPECHRLLGS